MVKMIIKTALFPVAGRGSRLQPFTNYCPKELLPVYDKPVVHYGIVEAQQCGIEHFVMVIAKGKEEIIKYITESGLLRPEQMSVVYQDKPLGLGHAVGVGAGIMRQRQEDGFLVIAPDDIMVANNGQYAIKKMMEYYAKQRGLYSLVERVQMERTRDYGILSVKEQQNDLILADNLVEKPQHNPPSEYGIIARYCLPVEIFDYIDQVAHGALGEIQLTDAMVLAMRQYNFFGVVSHNTRLDCGNPSGLSQASHFFAHQNI